MGKGAETSAAGAREPEIAWLREFVRQAEVTYIYRSLAFWCAQEGIGSLPELEARGVRQQEFYAYLLHRAQERIERSLADAKTVGCEDIAISIAVEGCAATSAQPGLVGAFDTTGDGLVDTLDVDLTGNGRADMRSSLLIRGATAKVSDGSAQQAFERELATGGLGLDTSGDGLLDTLALDTSGDGQIDTLRPLNFMPATSQSPRVNASL